MTTTLTYSVARAIGAAAILALAISGTACIQKETRSVMYLDPDGSVTWSIFESDARSDEKTPGERASEEAAYLRDALANPTRLAVLFESLGGRSVSRTVLKDTAPFEVHTVARFDRLDLLLESVCLAAGIRSVSRISWEGSRRRLTLEQIDKTDAEADVQALSDALEGLKLVLVEGTFVEAVGFTLKDARTVILNSDLDEDHLVLSLVWEPAKPFDARDTSTPWCPQDFVLSEYTGHRGPRPIVAVTASRSSRQ